MERRVEPVHATWVAIDKSLVAKRPIPEGLQGDADGKHGRD